MSRRKVFRCAVTGYNILMSLLLLYVIATSLAFTYEHVFGTAIPAGSALTAEEMRRLRFLCTEMEVAEGRVTGKFSTPNCYGPEKVRRLKEQLRLTRSLYIITAYGDSRGDKELLDFADVSHFKPFRE